MKRSLRHFDILSLCLFSVTACRGGKRECENPGDFSYEGKKAYSCLEENTSENGTKKVLVFKCEKTDYKPFVYEYTEEGEDGKPIAGFIYTCLDEAGNIDIPKLSTDSSLYCSAEKAGTWVRLTSKAFLRNSYFLCPEYTIGQKFPYSFSDVEIAEMNIFKPSFRDESLVICPLGEKNTSGSPREIVCGK